MDATNENVSTIKKHLDFLKDSTGQTILHYHGQIASTIEFFGLGLLYRLNACCAGLDTLISEIQRNILMEHSAGIILRACLLDFLLLFKGFEIVGKGLKEEKEQKEIKEELKTYCNSVFADGLEQSLKFVKNLKHANYIDQQKLEATYKRFADKHSRFFDGYEEDGKQPQIKGVYRRQLAAGVLFRECVDPANFNLLAEAYDMYMRFSKYDHYGIESLEAMHDAPEKRIPRLRRAVEILVIHNLACHSVLAEENNNTHEEFLQKHSLEALEYRQTLPR